MKLQTKKRFERRNTKLIHSKTSLTRQLCIEIMSKRSSFKSFLSGAFVGAAAGATVALLYSPKSGKKLRDDLKKKGEKAKKKLEKALETSQEIADNCREKIIRSPMLLMKLPKKWSPPLKRLSSLTHLIPQICKSPFIRLQGSA